MFGKEIADTPNLSFIEKTYIKIFGFPANGLRIRARRISPHILKNLNGVKTILDAGCGRGAFTFFLAKSFKDISIIGTDTLEQQVNINNFIAKKYSYNNCRFEIGDILNISDNEKFDLIISIDMLEHIDDHDQACQNIYKALNPGGKIIVHVPTKYRYFMFRKVPHIDIPTHVRPGYERDEIINLLERNKFIIDYTQLSYGFLETLCQDISYKITGAEEKNKYLYSIIFPFLLFISFFGQFSIPKNGNSIIVVAHKKR